MGKRLPSNLEQPPLDVRIVQPILSIVLWHLPRFLFRAVFLTIAFIWRLFAKPRPETPSADAFYRSYRWRRLRFDALEANRVTYGMLACECCGMVDARQWHVDHIYPRSTHPELALDPDNLQVLCDACNIGKGAYHTTSWRKGAVPDPAAGRPGWLAKLFLSEHR